MAHHSRYKRIAADRIPLLDEKVFNRKFANLVRRFSKSDMTAKQYMDEYVAISSENSCGSLAPWHTDVRKTN